MYYISATLHVDITDPVISDTPSDINMDTDAGSPTAVVTWTPEPTASDDSGTVTLTSSHSSGSAFPIGTTTVTYTATDGNSNTVVTSFDVIISGKSSEQC